jgi:asparagine N-glycosylation enzyme membrane subunit Stt3
VEPPVPEPGRRPEPIGAIILIALGLLFLFQSLGFMGSWWIGHSWPWILIAIGAWLLFRRLNDSAGGAQ